MQRLYLIPFPIKHLLFIVNPRSGTDRVKAIEAVLETRLDKNLFRYEIQLTECAGHGTDLARAAAEAGAYAVVAVGGDGSVADVAKGLYGTETALGILPKGSGNGFARSLGIPLALAGAVDILNKDRLLKVDVGFANEQLFLSNAGVAFDAEVTRLFAGSTRRGFRTYTEIILQNLFTYKARQWQLRVDGKEMTEDAFMVVVANGQQFGYNFKIAPGADYTDGLFDLVVVRRFPHIAAPFIALDSLLGRMHRNPYVETRQAREIEISHPELKIFHTDGDPYACDGKVVFRIESQALSVLC